MTSFDNELEKAAGARSWTIVRYADDITIVHYRTQKKEAVELVIRMLAPLGLQIERKKLKTYKSGYVKALGLVVTDTSIKIVRKARRTMRGLARKFLGKSVLKVKNAYSHEEAGQIRQRMNDRFARLKYSTTAVLAGYCAYLIGIDRPRRLTQF
jgi:hypothetical protein